MYLSGLHMYLRKSLWIWKIITLVVYLSCIWTCICICHYIPYTWFLYLNMYMYELYLILSIVSKCLNNMVVLTIVEQKKLKIIGEEFWGRRSVKFVESQKNWKDFDWFGVVIRQILQSYYTCGFLLNLCL